MKIIFTLAVLIGGAQFSYGNEPIYIKLTCPDLKSPQFLVTSTEQMMNSLEKGIKVIGRTVTLQELSRPDK